MTAPFVALGERIWLFDEETCRLEPMNPLVPNLLPMSPAGMNCDPCVRKGPFTIEVLRLIIRAMLSRRDAVASFALFADLVASGRHLDALAQTTPAAPGTPPPPVFRHDLPRVTMDDWEVTVSYVDYPPGRVGAAHHHAGFVLAYVLEGAVVTKISGQGEEKTYTVGQMFYEQPGATHEVSKNASQTQPARLLAMIFAKKGSTLTMPGPA
jgi:quercetin dioxygenase-like cupin family protein